MANVKPIPEGYHTLTPHIVVDNANEAIEFYKKAFGAVEVCRMMVPDGKRIMHAEIKIGDSHLMIADEFPDMAACGNKSARTLGGTPIGLHLYVTDVDQVFERVVKAGAKIMMPLDTMFWGDRYGKVQDPYGLVWSIATHVRDVDPMEMERASKEMFKEMAHA